MNRTIDKIPQLSPLDKISNEFRFLSSERERANVKTDGLTKRTFLHISTTKAHLYYQMMYTMTVWIIINKA